MRLLILITHGNIGGATNFVYWLAEGLKQKGVEVTVGFGEGDYLKNLLKKAGIDFVNFKWLKRTHNPIYNLFFIKEFKKYLDNNSFDVCHFNSTNALFGAIAAKLSKNKTKNIFTFHGLSILDPNYKKKYFLKIIYWLVFKFLLLFIDTPVFVCKANLETAKKLHLVKNGVVIYNGIPEPKFLSRDEARKFFAKNLSIDIKDKFIIGSIGRLDYSKNYEFLIKNFSEILKIKPNAICIIIGEGPERKKYEKLIKKLGLETEIFLLGEKQNASQYMKGFDLFILPSRYEGLSITLIEALFAQIPILASDVGGNKEIADPPYIFKINNGEIFIEKIKPLLIERGLSQQRINHRFYLYKLIDDYKNIYLIYRF